MNDKRLTSFVMRCEICQQCKYDAAASPGLLQPLPIPGRFGSIFTMDVIEGLPSSNGKICHLCGCG